MKTKSFFVAAMAAVLLGVAIPASAEDAYIESNGTQFMNTGYYVKPESRIELDFAFVDFANTSAYAQSRLFDNDANNSKPSIAAAVYVGGSAGGDCSLAACIGDCDSSHNFAGVWTRSSGSGEKGAYCDSTKRTIVLDELNKRIALEVGGEEIWFNDQSSARAFNNTSSWPLGLFGRTKNAAGTSCDYRSRIRVYGLRIYESDTLLHNYTPAIKNGVAGLLDSVTGTFLFDSRTSGAGAFAYGGYIPTVDDPYIESAGTSAINLGVSASPKLKIALDYALLEGNELQDRLLGQDTKDGSPRFSAYINDSGNIALAGGTDTAFNNVSTGIATNTARHTVVIDNVALRNAYMTGMTTNWTGYGATKADCTKCAARPLALFGNTANDAGTLFNQCTKMKVYGLKIWSGGELIRDLAPRSIDGTAGFEDLIFGGFYTCDGLTASADAPTTLTGASRELDAWVESDGTGAVNTGYFDGPNTKIEVDFQLAKINASGCVAGHWNNDYTAFIWCSGVDYFNIQGKDGGYESSVTPSPTVYQDHARHTAVLDSPNKTFSFYAPDGTLEGSVSADDRSWTYTKTSNWPFILFGGASDAKGNSKYRAKVRIYGVKFYESGVLKKTFTPALQYGVVGFVDETGKFYTGDGLTGGGNIKRLEGDFFYDPIRAEDAYIESDGTQGINLGYLTTPKTRYEIDYQMTGIVGQMRPFGQAISALSAELYIQGTATGSGNVAFGVGDEWKGQVSGVASDLNRHLAVLDLANRYCAYTGKGAYAFTSATVCTKTATYPMWLFAKGTSAAGAYESRAKMKLYAFRIYEAGVLVHEYLPYKNGDTVGLYDTMTGDVVTSTVSGSNAFTYGGGLGYGKYAGTKRSLVVKPSDAKIAKTGDVTLSAYAPGAVGYVWKKNGEELAGETGETLKVNWRNPGKEAVDTYTVAPVFLVEGKEVEGEEQSCEVENLPLGLLIILR